MTIPTIHLGDGLEVSQLGFGGMALSHVYGDVNEEQAERTLHAAIDCGITFIDTAKRVRQTSPRYHRAGGDKRGAGGPGSRVETGRGAAGHQVRDHGAVQQPGDASAG